MEKTLSSSENEDTLTDCPNVRLNVHDLQVSEYQVTKDYQVSEEAVEPSRPIKIKNVRGLNGGHGLVTWS